MPSSKMGQPLVPPGRSRDPPLGANHFIAIVAAAWRASHPPPGFAAHSTMVEQYLEGLEQSQVFFAVSQIGVGWPHQRADLDQITSASLRAENSLGPLALADLVVKSTCQRTSPEGKASVCE